MSVTKTGHKSLIALRRERNDLAFAHQWKALRFLFASFHCTLVSNGSVWWAMPPSTFVARDQRLLGVKGSRPYASAYGIALGGLQTKPSRLSPAGAMWCPIRGVSARCE